MDNSFKFIVNPKNTKQIEVTSFLQYCALKNTLSKFNSNKIKPFKSNYHSVDFRDDITKRCPEACFTEYIQMEQSEKDNFTKSFKEEYRERSLFYEVLAVCGHLKSFKYKERPPSLNYCKVEDLFDAFSGVYKIDEYLLKYTKYLSCNKSPGFPCIEEMPETTDKDFEICYDDESLYFGIVYSKYDDKEDIKEFAKLINCINESTKLQISKHNGHIENTHDDICVYTSDPDVICKVLNNNNEILGRMNWYINCIKDSLLKKKSYTFDIITELQSSITNIVNAYEYIKKD